MPAGLPSWRQIRVGLAIAIGLDFIAKAYKRKADQAEEEVMLKLKHSGGKRCQYPLISILSHFNQFPSV